MRCVPAGVNSTIDTALFRSTTNRSPDASAARAAGWATPESASGAGTRAPTPAGYLSTTADAESLTYNGVSPAWEGARSFTAGAVAGLAAALAGLGGGGVGGGLDLVGHRPPGRGAADGQDGGAGHRDRGQSQTGTATGGGIHEMVCLFIKMAAGR